MYPLVINSNMKATTIVFWDWDDTLFPTTACSNDGLIAKGGLKEWNINLLSSYINISKYKNISTLVYNTLSNYIKTYGPSNINIITNGGNNWPQLSLYHLSKILNDNMYLNILKLLKLFNINIVSARHKYSKYNPMNPNKWKYNAFQNILSNTMNKLSYDSYLKFITIGDRECDHTSLTKCINKDFNTKLKQYNIYIIHEALKLKEQTSLIQFHNQILKLHNNKPKDEYFTKEFRSINNQNQSMETTMNQSDSNYNDKKTYFTPHYLPK
eukprot:542140_1